MFGFSCGSIVVSLLLLLVILCTVSEGARYRAKFFIFVIFVAIITTCCIPLMFFRIGDWRNALMPAWGARQVAKLLGINFQVRGKENIVQDTGCIVFVNHQSALDLCVLAELWPVLERCAVISKKEVLYLGTFGLASWLWGTIFIDRVKGADTHSTINSTAEIIKARKAKVLMFPEGKRHAGTTLLPLKKGGFHVAIASQVPIQPVVVSKYYFLNEKLKKFDSGISYVTILPAIPTLGLTKEDLPQLIEKTYEIMNKSFQETTQEVFKKHVEGLKLD
ncbi:1-acyl-sn-glycerol-3-phosphate acyltransferase alpha [Belonocnema kinseyi]|uniref:1-acyl-sn-glycerol-3-phosphate acyltransferase alpha n=1 Tax=Belonocnema kinseyi TaxID=2817044 RepID=UPI00143D6457|nr:1-acyl-sn-glycerol-3-phosphate acyltransferase alpha [Belonocnema kinseyi]XP_033227879.1 1-acyl-sn-glycerol-3-phosphate acyltransferase alpha [Belonocnema kinseyi]